MLGRSLIVLVFLAVAGLAFTFLAVPAPASPGPAVADPILQGEGLWDMDPLPAKQPAQPALNTGQPEELELSDWEYTRFRRPVSPFLRPIPRFTR